MSATGENAGGHWITGSFPNPSVIVLLRIGDPPNWVWPGFFDGKIFRRHDATAIENPVLGWMKLEDAAAILDGRLS